MIYMVEHMFCLPELEDEWNAWYFGNLGVLLAVPGFHSAQRFRVPQTQPSRYMAMYTVDGPETFTSEVYVKAGGNGANSVRFRPAYQVWIRNLFAGVDPAPDVAAGHCLVTLDAAAPRNDTPAPVAWAQSVGFHRTTPWRGLAVVPASAAASWRALAGATVYEPHRDRQVPVG